MTANPVQASMLQIVDARFHRRMLFARRREFRRLFPRLIGFVQFAFRRRHIELQQLIQTAPVARTVKTPVKTRHS